MVAAIHTLALQVVHWGIQVECGAHLVDTGTISDNGGIDFVHLFIDDEDTSHIIVLAAGEIVGEAIPKLELVIKSPRTSVK